MDEQGNIVRSRKVSTLCSEVEGSLEGVKACCAVIETGRSSDTLVDLLDELGVKVTMARPKEVKSIAKAKGKTDKCDSQMLAHLLRTDMVPEVYQRSKENREVQKILRQRVFYVEAMTRVKNQIPGLIAQQREEVRREAAREKNLFSARGQKVIPGLSLAGTEKQMLASLVTTFRHLGDRLRETTALVKEV